MEPGYAATPAYATHKAIEPSTGTPIPVVPVKRQAMVSKPVWLQLEAAERESIERAYEVNVLEPDAFGVITDVQGADQSTAGTNSGAILGGAIGSAAYIDRAFSGGNSYSAGAHLAIGLLGALLGSAMDKAPETKFQFRYTVKQGDGEVQYFDEMKSSGFRHSPGVCVLIPSLTLASQQLCQQSPNSLRARYLAEST